MGLENVVITRDVDGEGRESVNLSTVDLGGEQLDDGVQNDGITNNNGSTTVNNDGVELEVEGTNFNGVSSNNVPGFKDDGVVLEGGRSIRVVNTTQNQFRIVTVFLITEVERERVVLN